MIPLALAATLAAALLLYMMSRQASSSPQRHRTVEERRAALAQGYAPVPPPPAVHPLRSPPGRVGVDEEGLVLELGPETAEPAYHRVPWTGVRQVAPTGGGTLAVEIDHVGRIEVPGRVAGALYLARGSMPRLPPQQPELS